MQQTNSTETHGAVTAPFDASTESTKDISPSAVDVLKQSGDRSPSEVSRTCDEPDFVEGHEDPAQSEELERQQDA